VNAIRLLHVCSEFAPLAKSGGLGDVTAGLAGALAKAGQDVFVVIPRYGMIDTAVAHIDPHPVVESTRFSLSGTELSYSVLRQLETPPNLSVFLVECRELFGQHHIYGSGDREAHRFMLLSRAAMALCRRLEWPPDIVHCHDWHTALLPLLLSEARSSDRVFEPSSSVLTIHNIGYQGVFPSRVMREAGCAELLPRFDAADVVNSEVNFLKTGIQHADALTTVSRTHAREIQSPAYGMGLDSLLRRRSHRLQGILNGVDHTCWNPATDPALVRNYTASTLAHKADGKQALIQELGLDVEAGSPLSGVVSRLVRQKGIDLLVSAAPQIFGGQRVGMVILGTGEPPYAAALRELADEFPGRMVFVEAHDEALAHRILAGADLFLVPSRYEPCGLTQLYALRYGTVPVVRRTGGLADTIAHYDPDTRQGNGSVFEHADAAGLRWAVDTALGWYSDHDTWQQLMRNGMAADFSWEHQALEYLSLYDRLLAGRD
jgi:starch synthase